MHSLPLFHRIAGCRVVVVGDGDMAEAKKRLVDRAGGIPCGETEAHHAALAFVAMEDERRAEAAALRLKRAGLLVNVADRPDLCDFTLPSVLDREPVLVAVSTGGASAGLAKHLRLRLEAFLPQSLGALASKLSEARERMREKWSDAGDRRKAIDKALCEGGQLDPLDPASNTRVEAWLEQDQSADSGPTIHEFHLASDDPDDLTIRQARLLGIADAILHDPAISEAVLIRARADAARHELPHRPPTAGVTVILRRAD
ncbi:precorrin-2 dehydrogenase/sirohydrochlorin ferrochelatase family protein [Qipengyuania sphaerica]|uniref:precorrin-2 dehydrogenase/sirohydrochlorin ferrochelatase family protein n=1 Tax=Qipengyuania sphaerica TaxID=2867243 RepID=UPI001C881419|nr:bifunctional precorrin-2 dehydrogenase/sirohydrochlorin ferrochelatase [Qipengyuania sphaerica]MBX7541135.1 siroheme synthase [Qipengyuania sphaerica]